MNWTLATVFTFKPTSRLCHSYGWVGAGDLVRLVFGPWCSVLAPPRSSSCASSVHICAPDHMLGKTGHFYCGAIVRLGAYDRRGHERGPTESAVRGLRVSAEQIVTGQVWNTGQIEACFITDLIQIFTSVGSQESLSCAS